MVYGRKWYNEWLENTVKTRTRLHKSKTPTLPFRIDTTKQLTLGKTF